MSRNVINLKELKEVNAPKKYDLKEEDVSKVSFFNEDLDEISNQLAKGEELYGELHATFSELTRGEYMHRSVRDLAELGKTMVSARVLCVDTIAKRHAIKKTVSDVVQKKHGIDTEVDTIKETAKAILLNIKQEGIEAYGIKTVDKTKNVVRKTSDDEKRKLEERVNRSIKHGDIKLSQNDRLIGVSDHTSIQYNKRSKRFIAIDDRNGAIIPGFPEERLPQVQVTRITDDQVYTSSGDVYSIYGVK
jgi:hypothetical protein